LLLHPNAQLVHHATHQEERCFKCLAQQAQGWPAAQKSAGQAAPVHLACHVAPGCLHMLRSCPAMAGLPITKPVCKVETQGGGCRLPPPPYGMKCCR
jgi:hypothetical protein